MSRCSILLCFFFVLVTLSLGCSPKPKSASLLEQFGDSSSLTQADIFKMQPEMRVSALSNTCEKSVDDCGQYSEPYIDDPDKRVRIQAAINLVRTKYAPALHKMLDWSYKADKEERQYISNYIGSLGSLGFEELLRRIALMDSKDVKRRNLESLLPNLPNTFLRFMQDKLAKSPPDEHANLYRLIGDTLNPQAVSILLPMIESDSLGSHIAENLAKIQGEETAAKIDLYLLQELRGRSRSIVILRLVELLGRVGSIENTDVLTSLKNYPDRTVAESARKSLYRISNKTAQ